MDNVQKKHRMVLRSSCAESCSSILPSSPLTMRKLTTPSSKSHQSHSHKHHSVEHGHTHTLPSTSNATPRSQSQSSLQMTSATKKSGSLKMVAHHEPAPRVSVTLSSRLSFDSSDEKPKTDYTYVRSGGYSSRVSPTRKAEMPNMSRPLLRGSSYSLSASSLSSISDETCDQQYQMSNHAERHDERLSTSITTNSNLQALQQKHLHNIQRSAVPFAMVTSTPVGVNGSIQGMPSGSVLTNVRTRGAYNVRSRTYSGFEQYEQSNMENVHEFSWSRRMWRRIERTLVFRFVGTCVRKTISVWYYMWLCIYSAFCHLLVWDTWLLSRCSRLRSWKILLPLLLLLLCLLFYRYSDVILNDQESGVSLLSSQLYHYVVPHHMLDYLTPWKWFWWQSGDDDDALLVLQPLSSSTPSSSLLSSSSPSSVTIEDSTISFAWLASGFHWAASSISNLWPYSSSAAVSKDEGTSQPVVVDEGSVKPEEVLNKVILQKMEPEEVDKLRMDMKAWTASLSKELTQKTSDLWKTYRENMAKLQEQSKVLADEVATMKLILNAKQSSEAVLHSYAEENRRLREDVNRLERELQAYSLAMRNCCQNRTAFLSDVEDQFSALLLKVMKEKPDERFAPLQSSLKEWLGTSSVHREEMGSLFADMEARIMKNASGEIKRMMDDVSKLVATLATTHAASTAAAGMMVGQRHRNVSSSSSSGDDGKCLLRDEVQNLIDDKLMQYDADKTGMVDYALESAGGSILSTRCAETYYGRIARYTIFGLPIWYSAKSPRTVIQPEVYPGQCWPFKGSQGYLVIGLSATIRPTAFSLEHIPKSLSTTGSIDSAPKDFSVWGLVAEDDYDGKLLGQYTYREDGPPLQHFIVQDPDPGAFPIIELRIHSNHGNMEYTCLYRFRVHGKKV